MHVRKRKKHTPIQKHDGAYAIDDMAEMIRWAQWIKGNFYKPEQELQDITIEQIAEKQWVDLEEQERSQK